MVSERCSKTYYDTATVDTIINIFINVNGDTLITNSGMWKYQWFKDGDTIPGANNNIYVMTANGSYYVSVRDSNGCKASSTPFVRNSIDEGGNKTLFKIYPNPNNGEFNINFNNQSKDIEYIKVLNALGIEIKSFNLQQSSMTNSIKINLKGYPKGLYLITITNSDGLQSTNRIIIN